MNSTPINRPGRSFELKVLIVGLLVVSLASWLRLRLAVLNWEFLPELGAAASPLYLALSAGVWGLLSLACAVGLYFRQAWAPNLTRLTCVLLTAWYWVERLSLTQSDLSAQNWPFALGFTLAILVFTFGTLALKAQKAFFNS